MLPLIMVSLMGLPQAQDKPIEPTVTPSGFLNKEIRVHDRAYRYVVYVPRQYEAATKWPCIVFLHGAGECGTDGLKQVAQGIGTAILLEQRRWPAIVVMPQKPDVKDAWEDHDAAVMAMLEATIAEYNIDPDRLYLTGLSQGGHGAWIIGARHSDRWAAVVPICGYGAPEAVLPLKDTPVWCFHGGADEVVPPDRSQSIIDALIAAGGTPKLTIFPGVGHNSWDKAYRDPELAAWLFTQRKAKTAKP
ncbi:MAG: prolyl oligopeptidase family serine peptidase [Chthonomonadales bacterium]|nr:prolyl oligopeptidase family serine peptidase [Chthonomonadales bacterium]